MKLGGSSLVGDDTVGGSNSVHRPVGVIIWLIVFEE